ncbi:MAG: glycogen debranching N-terminal domain-containing protein [Thiohalocapsa sp.]
MPTVKPLHPMPAHIVAHHDHTVLIADLNGFIGGGTEGLFYRLTRFLSRLRLKVGGAQPRLVAATEVSSWAVIAYYLAPSPAGKGATPDPQHDDPEKDEIVQKAIELQVNRSVDSGLRDELILTNHGLAPAQVELRWELDADFADYQEAVDGKRQQNAPVERDWRIDDDVAMLVLSYRHKQLRHATEIRFAGPAAFADDGAGAVCTTLDLPCQSPVRVELDLTPVFCGAPVTPRRGSDAPDIAARQPELALHTPNALVQAAWDRAAADLMALALLDGDGAERLMPAAGIPKYAALFGRDVLVTAFQAASLDPEMLRGSLRQVAKYTATQYDDRFDAEPGSIIHQHQQSPLALLEKNPFLHYYGDYSAEAWFLIDVAWDFLVTGDRDFFRSMQEKVLQTLAWMERDGDSDRDGFYEYATKAGEWGEKNQGWKDSRDAILYEDGRRVPNPIALVEIQGSYYAAKLLMAMAFAANGDDERAAQLRAAAARLKARFNAAFRLPEENYFALALDPAKQPVRSIAPDIGQCLLYGIVADEHVAAVVERLMMPDLFTGWGLRTLSSRHPAYNPFSYHLGSVWPVSNATIAFGFKRYGFTAEAHRLAKALFEASALFELQRLPEVFGGQPRDEDHPHPGIYPDANAPQAWSASAVILLIQTLLGLVPAAPWRTLVIDPDLPDWLPELTLANIRVGDGRATIRFRRTADGGAAHDVLDRGGALRVIRLPPRPPGTDALAAVLEMIGRPQGV